MIKNLTIIISLFLIHSAVLADIIASEDWENGFDEYKWRAVNCTQGSNVGEISTTYAHNGTHSWRSHVQAFDVSNPAATNCSINLQHQSWMTGTNNFDFNTVYWVGYAFYVPATTDYPDDTTILGDGQHEWLLISQWHGIIEACDTPNLNPPVSFHPDDTAGTTSFTILGDDSVCTDKWNIDSKAYPTFQNAPTRGAWHRVVLQIRFDYNAGGNALVKVWMDDNLQFEQTTQNCYNQAKGPYWMIGPYGHMENSVDVYFDDIKIGDANSSYAQVAPIPPGGGSDTTPPAIYDLSVSADGITYHPTGRSFPAGTNTPYIRVRTNEPATARWDTTDIDYDLMGNTMTPGPSSLYHTDQVACADGQSCSWHVKAEDTSGNESIDYLVALQIDTPGGGATSLVNAQTLKNYDGERPSQFFDGCIDDLPTCMPEETSPMQFEADFGVEMDALRYRLFCDAVGTRVSELLDVDYWDGSTWQNFETDTDVYFTGWLETELTGIHTTKLRFTITNSVVGTVVQVRELEVFGTLYQGGGGGGVVIPASITRPTMRRVGTGPKPKIMRIR